MTILAIFRSRAQTLDYLAGLKSVGVVAQTVNTPKEAGIGCGISVKFDSAFLVRAKGILGRKPYSSFVGYMKKAGDRFFYL